MNTVFVDIDTQLDFLLPAGALYVPGAERLIPLIGALNRHAIDTHAVLISTVDAHRENDPEFLLYPPHCVSGTLGQKKPETTLNKSHVVIRSNAKHDFPADTAQIIFEKQTTNCFTSAALKAFIEDLPAQRYVVYGVVTEICVKFAALGLLDMGKHVEIVTDAVQSLDASAADELFREFQAAGGLLTEAAAVQQSR